MTWEIFGRLLLSVAIGAAIGAERETRSKPAGFRTITLICLGSTLFTIWSIELAGDSGDRARVAAQIVTGVGFLGAGAILREGSHIKGLTTAATIWIAAALGIGIGAGHWKIAVPAAVIAVLILVLFQILERSIDLRRESETYTVGCDVTDLTRLEAMVAESGLALVGRRVERDGDTANVRWSLLGRHEQHLALAQRLFDEPSAKSLRVGR